MNTYYQTFEKTTTTDGGVNEIAMRGRSACVRISATGDNVYYLWAPSSSDSVIAAVTGVSVKVVDSMYLLTMTEENRNKFRYGQVILLQNASDTDTAVAIVTSSPTDGLVFTRTQVPIRIIKQAATDATSSAANVADTTKIKWADPSVADGIGVLLEVGEPHLTCPPDWAKNGVLKFVRVASTNATLHVDSVLP